MAPLSQLSRTSLSGVRAVLTDIDDTLTTDGRLSAEAYSALERLQAAGLIVVPITGRPAGWCDMIARTWPVDAVVGENGAFYFRYDDNARRMIRNYASPASRAENRARLDALATRILAEVPGAAISADQSYREADLAIDFCEDVPPLPEPDVQRIAALFAEAGATAKISSIHVNGWFGTYDKLTMTRRCLAEQFSIDIDATPEAVTFAGDSPNDAPMFGFFPLSVGVANVIEQRDRCEHLPAFVTPSQRGRGFAELATAILAARA
jgi:HAD superfamily hydrolase (TIGR01484 family)